MAKKIFVVFTIVMVTITGICFYVIVSKAKNELSNSPKIEAKINQSKTNPPLTPEPTPLQKEERKEEKKQEKEAKSQENLTKSQKYYTRITEPGNKNILLVGKDPTYSNYDTMVIVCINEKNKSVSLTDIPRDIYIDYSDEILEKLKVESDEFFNEKGSRKINAAHVVGRILNYSPKSQRFLGKSGIGFLSDLVKEIFAVEIDDYVAIETDGFREIVDYFGGVVIDVPVYMHYEDPTQDLYIHLEPGLQLLNGTNAEGFVRFRQGYDREGKLINYSRADNTFLFLKSFFEQHVNLKNLSKIGRVYEIVRENTETSVKSIGDTYEYAKLAKEIIEDDYNLKHANIKTSGKKEFNGALYEILKTE